VSFGTWGFKSPFAHRNVVHRRTRRFVSGALANNQ
jgi:hypothetical protein